MKYQIRNSNLDIVLQNFKSEANAIKRLRSEDERDGHLTANQPFFVTEDNGEITALIYCGVVYRPDEEA